MEDAQGGDVAHAVRLEEADGQQVARRRPRQRHALLTTVHGRDHHAPALFRGGGGGGGGGGGTSGGSVGVGIGGVVVVPTETRAEAAVTHAPRRRTPRPTDDLRCGGESLVVVVVVVGVGVVVLAALTASSGDGPQGRRRRRTSGSGSCPLAVVQEVGVGGAGRR